MAKRINDYSDNKLVCDFKLTIGDDDTDFSDFVQSYELNMDFFQPYYTFDVDVLYDEFALKNLNNFHEATLPLKPISFYLNNNRIFRGYIDSHRISNEGRVVSLTARDYRALMIDAHIDPAAKILKDQLIDKAILTATNPVGILEINNKEYTDYINSCTGVKIDNKVVTSFKEKLNQKTPDPDCGIYEWVNQIAITNGYTIQPTNKKGCIALVQPNFAGKTNAILKRTEGNNVKNNILKSSVERNYETMPTYSKITNKYGNVGTGKAVTGMTEIQTGIEGKDLGVSTVIRQNSELKSVFKFGDLNNDRIVYQKPKEAVNLPENGGRIYKPMFIRNNECKSAAEAERFLKRMFADRFKNTLKASFTLSSHVLNNVLLMPDISIYVSDYYGFIEEDMWIESVRHYADLSNGQRTDLTLFRSGSIVI